MIRILVDKYLNYNEVFSYNMRHNFIVGDRGVGKTFGLTRWLLKKCIYENKKFIWVRNSDEALKSLLKNDGLGFLANHPEFIKVEASLFRVSSGTLFYNDNIIGTFLPLSGFFKIKGINYDDYEYFVFDEFMPETGEAIRIDYEYALKSIMQSVFRKRTNFKAVYMANVLKTANDMLEFFKFDIQPRFEGQVKQINKKLSAIIFYLQDIDREKSESRELEGDAFALANKYTESSVITDYEKNIDPNCMAKVRKKELLFYLTTDKKIFLLRENGNKISVMAVKGISETYNLPVYAMHKKYVYGVATYNKKIKEHLDKLWVNGMFVFKSESVLREFKRGILTQ